MLTNNRGGHKSQQGALILDSDGAERLAVAIVKQAADDYERTLMKMLRKPPKPAMKKLMEEKAETERFFLSPWFEVLVDIDGRRLMKQIQRNAVTKEKKRVEAKLEKARKQMEKKMQKGE